MDTNDPWNTAIPTLQTLLLSVEDDNLADKIYNILPCGRPFSFKPVGLEFARAKKIYENVPPEIK